MAEQMAENKTIEDLEKEITCGICQQHFTDPRYLPGCLHYYCKSCIVKLSQAAGSSRSFRCPECRVKVVLSGGVDILKTNCIVNRLKDTYLSHIKSESKQEKCTLHNEPMKIFCLTCNQSICRDCVLKDKHKDHPYLYNSEIAPRKKKYLGERVEPLRKVEADFKDAVRKIEEVRSSIVSHGKSTANFIDEYFRKLQNALEEHKKNLLEEVKLEVAEKVDNLQAQEKELFDTLSCVREVIKNTDHCVSSCGDDEFMSKFADLEGQIQDNLEDFEYYFEFFDEDRATGATYANYDLTPVENSYVDVELQTIPSFLTMCKKKNYATHLNFFNGNMAINSTCLTEEMKTKASFVFHNKNADANIACHITADSDEPVQECNVSRIGFITYLVEYDVPESPGKYKIKLLVNEEQVGQHPLTLTVNDSRSFLKKLFG